MNFFSLSFNTYCHRHVVLLLTNTEAIRSIQKWSTHIRDPVNVCVGARQTHMQLSEIQFDVQVENRWICNSKKEVAGCENDLRRSTAYEFWKSFIKEQFLAIISFIYFSRFFFMYFFRYSPSLFHSFWHGLLNVKLGFLSGPEVGMCSAHIDGAVYMCRSYSVLSSYIFSLHFSCMWLLRVYSMEFYFHCSRVFTVS